MWWKGRLGAPRGPPPFSTSLEAGKRELRGPAGVVEGETGSPQETASNSTPAIPGRVFQSLDIRLKKASAPVSSLLRPPIPTSITGLEGGVSKLHVTTLSNLTTPTKTPKRRFKASQHYDPRSDVFKNWTVTNKQEHAQRTPTPPYQHKGKLADSLDTSTSYDDTLLKSCRRKLMKSSLNASSTLKKTRKLPTVPTVKHMNSHDRKMLSSEQRCYRKVSSSSALSSNSPKSSSGLSFNSPVGSSALSPNSPTNSPVLSSYSPTSFFHEVLRLKGGGGGNPDESDSGEDQSNLEILDSEPVGMSFDSSNTSSETCEFEIADECDLSRKVIQEISRSKGVEDCPDVENDLIERSEVYDFVEEEEETPQIDPQANKNPKAVCCNNLCISKEIPLQVQNKFEEMKMKGKKEIKQFLLDHLIKQEDIGLPTHGFQFFGIFFCKKSFAQFTGLSNYIVTEVLKAFEFGQTYFVHGNEVGLRESEATLGFVIWMKQHSKNYGNQAPDEETIVLPACFSQKDLFEQYQDEAPVPLIKSSTFYRLFKSKFGPHRVDKSLPHIRISSYSTHSKCDQCILLEKYQRRCKSEQDLEFAKSLKQSHKQTYQRAYRAIQEKRHKAIYDPENNIFLQVDDMDNHKSHLPQSPVIGKTSGSLFRLPTKVTGCIIWSGKYPQNRKVVFFINHDQFEQSGSKLVSVLYKLLHIVKEDFGHLPRHLGINLDNCWRLVRRNEIENVFKYFFFPGRTKIDIFSHS